MRSRNQKKEDSQYSILTPWEVDVEDTPINRYCSNLMSPNPETNNKDQKSFPNINRKKRAISNCNGNKNENIPPLTDKAKFNKSNNQFFGENYQSRAFMTMTQNRLERTQKKKQTIQRGPLQQLSVKNFIIEGEQKKNMKDNKGKKKQSSYILKQKFNELRRSMKSIQHFKENCNLKFIRYE